MNARKLVSGGDFVTFWKWPDFMLCDLYATQHAHISILRVKLKNAFLPQNFRVFLSFMSFFSCFLFWILFLCLLKAIALQLYVKLTWLLNILGVYSWNGTLLLERQSVASNVLTCWYVIKMPMVWFHPCSVLLLFFCSSISWYHWISFLINKSLPRIPISFLICDCVSNNVPNVVERSLSWRFILYAVSQRCTWSFFTIISVDWLWIRLQMTDRWIFYVLFYIWLHNYWSICLFSIRNFDS